MTRAPIYLDHNGTTPVDPAVAAAMWPYLTEHHGNPSSQSSAGRRARTAVGTARQHVAELIGAHPDEITFTSGGTEANNLAIRGGLAATSRESSARIVTSQVEHPATAAPVEYLESQGATVTRLGVDAQCHLLFDAWPGHGATLGTLILAQNETGTLQPVRDFAEKIHAVGGFVHTDAAQAIGKVRVNVDELGVDALSIAGHKLYAPKGVGALYLRRGSTLAPLVRGASQENGLRPGTENVAGIVGLGVAAQSAAESLQSGEAERQEELRDHLWKRLSGSGRFVRLSPESAVLPQTLMVSAKGRLGRDVLAACPQVEASTGSACHSGVDLPSSTLMAMGCSTEDAQGAIRLTLGRSTSATQINCAADALVQAVS